MKKKSVFCKKIAMLSFRNRMYMTQSFWRVYLDGEETPLKRSGKLFLNSETLVVGFTRNNQTQSH